ncbi:MAG: FAD-binding protein [Treponema sp.]|nr:FAD-binding protein [Treponema sp.]
MKIPRKLTAGLRILFFCLVLPGLIGCSPETTSEEPKGVDGVYVETIPGHSGDVKVSIKVENGALTDVQVEALGETPDLGGAAAQKLAARILETQSVDIDAVSGASVTSAAVLVAARACFVEAGLVSRTPVPGEDVTIDGYDVVVVGGGASGFAATLAAQEKGAKVLVLEQTGQLGGLSLTAFGILGAESDKQMNGDNIGGSSITLTEDQKEKISVDYLFNWIQNNYNHFRSNGNLVRAILEKSGDTIGWLSDNGIQSVLLTGIDQGRHVDYPKTYHMWGVYNFFDAEGINQFTRAWRRLQNQNTSTGEPLPAGDPGIISNPIRVELFTRGQKLITSGGAVTGVEAERFDGTRVIVNAKQVILTTGGYGADTAQFKEKTEINYYNYFGYGNHGDGIRMALEAGADELNDHILQIHMADMTGTPAIGAGTAGTVGSITDLPHLWVDLTGSRFTDESAVYDNVFWGNAAFSVGGRYFIIFDQATIDLLKTEGSAYLGNYGISGVGYFDFAGAVSDGKVTVAEAGTEGPWYDGSGYVGKIWTHSLAPVTELQNDLDKLLVSHPGSVFKSASLADLAQKTGMDSAKLQASVTAYNTAVTNKKDTQYFKDPYFLTWKVETGPFYAISMQGSTYGSIGGVRVNERLQAVDQNGITIPNLYVGGADAGGMWDNSYPDLEGLSQCFAMNSGRIAGENAAAATGH